MIIIHQYHPIFWNLFGSMASLNWGFLRQVLATSVETLPEGLRDKDGYVHDVDDEGGDDTGDNDDTGGP